MKPGCSHSGEKRDAQKSSSTKPEIIVITVPDDSPVKQGTPPRRVIAIPIKHSIGMVSPSIGKKKNTVAYRFSPKPVSSPSTITTPGPSSSHPSIESLLMDSSGNIRPEFRNVKVVASAVGPIPSQQRMTLPPTNLPAKVSVNPVIIGTIRVNSQGRQCIKLKRSKVDPPAGTKSKRPRRPASPVPQSITLTRVGQTMTAKASPPPPPPPPPAVHEPLSVGQSLDQYKKEPEPTIVEKKREDDEQSASQSKIPPNYPPYPKVPKKMWNWKWGAMANTVTATDVSGKQSSTVSNNVQATNVVKSSPILSSAPVDKAVAVPVETAVDVNKNVESSTPESDTPASNKADTATIQKIIKMYVEYTRGVMRKYQAGRGQRRNGKKKTPSSEYTIQEAKRYFEAVFLPRLRQLGHEKMSAQIPKYFERTALNIITNQEAFCKNCGITDNDCWCPCRASRSGDELIASVIRNFEGKTDFVKWARQEVMKLYQPKGNQDANHSVKHSKVPEKAQSKKNAKSGANDECVVRQAKKPAFVVRGKHFLRPRALPTRKSKKLMWD